MPDNIQYNKIKIGTKGQDLVDVFNSNFNITKEALTLIFTSLLKRVISDTIKELKFDETTNKVYYTLDDADTENKTWKYIGTVWGQLEGNILDQKDLKEALDSKVNQTDYDKLVIKVNTNSQTISTMLIDISDLKTLANNNQGRIIILEDDVADIKLKLLNTVSSQTIKLLRVSTATGGVEYSIDNGLSWTPVTGSEKLVEWGQIQGDILNQADLQAILHDMSEDIDANITLVNTLSGKVSQIELDYQNLTQSYTEFKNQIQSDLTTHIDNKQNPHNVTKTQLGLGNVDNTADVNKPLSTAQKNYIDTEIAKVVPAASMRVGYGNSNSYNDFIADAGHNTLFILDNSATDNTENS